MGVQSGANLTGATVGSQSHELKTSSITDCNAMTTAPPMGGGSEAGAQESPSTSDVKLEYDIVLPDKGKGKAVPDNTAQGGSGHDPTREQERMSHLSRQNESDNRSRSHSVCHHLTTRLDDKEIRDGITSEINRVAKRSDEIMAKVIRRAEEGRIETQASIANLHQCVNTLRESCRKCGAETSCS